MLRYIYVTKGRLRVTVSRISASFSVHDEFSRVEPPAEGWKTWLGVDLENIPNTNDHSDH